MTFSSGLVGIKASKVKLRDVSVVRRVKELRETPEHDFNPLRCVVLLFPWWLAAVVTTEHDHVRTQNKAATLTGAPA